ncbi:MAG TPA: EamA family transporter [Micromonosporaceae bacterium]
MGAAVPLAAASALVWGSADYCGGRASRWTSPVTSALAAEVAGLPVLAVALMLAPAPVHPADLGWAAAAGVCGLAGLTLLYRGLAMGVMAVVAPVTGVTGATVPVVFGLATDAAPSPVSLAGVACAVGAIALVSLGAGDHPEAEGLRPGTARTDERGRRRSAGGRPVIFGGRRPISTGRQRRAQGRAEQRARWRTALQARPWPRGGGHGNGPAGRGLRVRLAVVGTALIAGALFGLFFVLLDQTSAGSGLWPLAAIRLGSIPFGVLLVLVRRDPLRPPRQATGWLLGAGVGDILANGLFLVALREGLLSVVAPIAALYPVSTVMLALWLDRERMRPVQVAGLGLAATAVVLTAL